MTTPIQELTARECAEGASHIAGPTQGKPIMPEVASAPVVIEEVALPPVTVQPVLTNPDKPLLGSFLKHLQDEIADEEAKEA